MKTMLKLGYGAGQTSSGVKNATFTIFLFFYFNQVLGLSGGLAGMASLLALIVDAITDPMVGQLSDRYKSLWGRRHPFMLIGTLPFGIAIYLLFAPPAGLDESGLFAWMLGLRTALVSGRRDGARLPRAYIPDQLPAVFPVCRRPARIDGWLCCVLSTKRSVSKRYAERSKLPGIRNLCGYTFDRHNAVVDFLDALNDSSAF
jgi:hypothetical protein